MGAVVALSPVLAAAPLLQGAAAVVACAAAAAAFALPSERARAVAVLVALVLTPVLLVDELARSGQLETLTSRPALLAVAGLAGFALCAALAALLVRHPALLAPLAVGALPFRVPVAAGGETANLLVPLYAVVGAAGLAYAWRRLRPSAGEPAAARASAAELALVAAIALYAVQALYTSDFAQALENVVFFYVPFALLLRALTSIEWSRALVLRCVAVAVSLALLFVAVGYWEWATRRLLLNPKVIASNQFESYFRVNSLFFDPNIYGRFLALVMLVLAGVLLWARRARIVLAAAALSLVLWGGLLLTFSQSSFTALLAGLAVLAAVRWGLRRVAPAIGAALLVGIALVVLAPGAIGVDLGSARSVELTTSGRFELMRGGIELFTERPVLGHGSGSFSDRFQVSERVTSQQAVSASHTIPITVGAEQGLVGLVAYGAVLLTALGLLLAGLARGAPRGDWASTARAVLAACFVALVVHTWLYAAFLEDPIAWALVGIGAGLRSAAGRVALPAGAATGARAAREGGGMGSRPATAAG